MSVADLIDEYLYTVDHLRTRRWYEQKLAIFRQWAEREHIGMGEIRAVHIKRFTETLRSREHHRTGEPLSEYTVRGYIQVVKGFLTYCAKEEVNKRVEIELPHVEESPIEVFTKEQIRALMTATGHENTTTLRIRDQAILAMLLDTGIRAEELCTLTLDRCFLHVTEPYIDVLGKGRKRREVGLSQAARRQIHRYVTRFRTSDNSVYNVFVGRHGHPISPSGLDQMLYRLRDWSGVTGVRVSAHTFRHTFAVHYLLAGGDIYMLSRILGHTTVSTTEIYLRAVKSQQVRRAKFSILEEL